MRGVKRRRLRSLTGPNSRWGPFLSRFAGEDDTHLSFRLIHLSA